MRSKKWVEVYLFGNKYSRYNAVVGVHIVIMSSRICHQWHSDSDQCGWCTKNSVEVGVVAAQSLYSYKGINA